MKDAMCLVCDLELWVRKSFSTVIIPLVFAFRSFSSAYTVTLPNEKRHSVRSGLAA